MTEDDAYYTDVIISDSGEIFASRLNNLSQQQCQIVRIAQQSPQAQVLTRCGEHSSTELLFDEQAQRLVYRKRMKVSQPFAIYSFELDTQRERQITNPAQVGNTIGDYRFTFSEDKRQVAVVEYGHKGRDSLKIIDLASLQTQITAPFISGTYSLVWQGNELFTANSEGLHVFNIERQSITLIDENKQIGRISEGDRDNRLLAEYHEQVANLYVVKLPTGNDEKTQIEPKPLTRDSGISGHAVISPSGNSMAYSSRVSGLTRLLIKPLIKKQASARVATKLIDTQFHEAIDYISAIAWSSDDKLLFAVINDSLYQYSLETGAWQHLTPLSAQIHHISFYQDYLVFSAEYQGKWNVWQLNLTTEALSQLTHQGGYSAFRDEDSVYFTKFNQAGLYKRNIESGEVERLINDFPITGWRYWQLREQQISYYANPTIYTYDVKTEQLQKVKTFTQNPPTDCQQSSDIGTFVCQYVDYSASNIVSIELTR